MSLSHTTESRTITADLLEPDDLRALTNTRRFQRTPHEVDEALRAAASRIEAQSEIIRRQSVLIGRMRVGLQPFAMAATAWQGPDSDPIVDGRGFQINKGHFRRARKDWGSRP